jgi:pilus assembly protein TadC
VTALAWLGAGVALLLWPGGQPAPEAGQWLRRWLLQAVAATATAAMGVVVVGGVRGLAAAVLAAPLAAAAVRHLDARPRRAEPDARVALALDLTAAVLRCGRPVADALELGCTAADAATAARLGQVAGLMRLGADARVAWRTLADDPVLAPVAQAAARSAESGVRLARTFEQAAESTRDCLRAQAEVRAHRAGVLVMLPLGLCFLPAFICLGIVPIVVGVAHGAFTGIP